jgi:hypothetical protein
MRPRHISPNISTNVPARFISVRRSHYVNSNQEIETISQYVSARREMAAGCDCTAEELDERVRDQFVAWVASDDIRKRLFQEPASKSLADVISLAITIERNNILNISIKSPLILLVFRVVISRNCHLSSKTIPFVPTTSLVALL